MGEDLAHRYLRKQGCTIVARRYRPNSGGGEIDLVAWHKQTLIFVEVKTRASAEYGDPERAVDAEKQIYLAPRAATIRAAQTYLGESALRYHQRRFDAST